jgi:hypothetical protein
VPQLDPTSTLLAGSICRPFSISNPEDRVFFTEGATG